MRAGLATEEENLKVTSEDSALREVTNETCKGRSSQGKETKQAEIREYTVIVELQSLFRVELASWIMDMIKDTCMKDLNLLSRVMGPLGQPVHLTV